MFVVMFRVGHDWADSGENIDFGVVRTMKVFSVDTHEEAKEVAITRVFNQYDEDDDIPVVLKFEAVVDYGSQSISLQPNERKN